MTEQRYTIELVVYKDQDMYGVSYFDVVEAMESIPANISYTIKEGQDD